MGRALLSTCRQDSLSSTTTCEVKHMCQGIASRYPAECKRFATAALSVLRHPADILRVEPESSRAVR